jgi:hypothetical protein
MKNICYFLWVTIWSHMRDKLCSFWGLIIRSFLTNIESAVRNQVTAWLTVIWLLVFWINVNMESLHELYSLLLFHAHPCWESRQDPCTNAITPLNKNSFRNTDWQPGSRFTGQSLGLRSNHTLTLTGISWNTVPDFRFHAHPRWASRHDPQAP